MGFLLHSVCGQKGQVDSHRGQLRRQEDAMSPNWLLFAASDWLKLPAPGKYPTCLKSEVLSS